MNYVTFSTHADRENAMDTISAVSQMAREAIRKYGADAVINSTMGECQDDKGNLMVLPTVERLLRQAPVTDICAYAPMGGIPGFNEAVQISLFGQIEKRWFVESVPTPGGCGALRHAVWNFLEDGEAVLSTDYHWGPYREICQEHNRRFCTFSMFNDAGKFNTEAFRAAAEKILEQQPRLLVILNTPANNPTGYSMTKEEMERVMNILRRLAEEPTRKITLCLDVSYIDFAGSFEESRAVFDAIGEFPPNMLVTLVFSMSKSYTMCGMRCGAIVCLSPEKAAAERFKQVMSVSSRATWSNVVRLAQKVLVEICSDPALKQQTDREREHFKQIIDERGALFLQAAREAGIVCRPYDHGYFLTILCRNPARTAQILQKRQIYVVPMANGLRFSPCAVSSEKCRKAPALIKEAIEEVEEIDANSRF